MADTQVDTNGAAIGGARSMRAALVHPVNVYAVTLALIAAVVVMRALLTPILVDPRHHPGRDDRDRRTGRHASFSARRSGCSATSRPRSSAATSRC
jgi:hypothetical protein